MRASGECQPYCQHQSASVSISQPHVRPIVRSKVRAKTEFGAKVSLSLEEGLCDLERFDFESYNECEDLIAQVESYRKRLGAYPESVHADNAYRNSKNRRYCREHGIPLSGAPLRQHTITHDKQAPQELIDRVPIEGKIGEAKRRYSLGLVMTKLASTSKTNVAITIIAMNRIKLLRQGSSSLFFRVLAGLNLLAETMFMAQLEECPCYTPKSA